MNYQEQNWTNLFGDITTEGIAWHGIWTSYSPDKNVIKSFRGVRNFVANEDRSLITHTNTYTYQDGSTSEISWKIEKQTCNQPDGLIHPAMPFMKTLSFGKGINAFISKILEPGKKFGAELFFQHEEWRTSVAGIYAESGDLERITLICERLGSFPDRLSDSELPNLSGNWIGKKEYMTPDLKISPAEAEQQVILEPNKDKNQTFFLSDGVVFNLPNHVETGEEIEIIGGKLVTENEYQRLTVKYDRSGNFALVISETFHRQ